MKNKHEIIFLDDISEIWNLARFEIQRSPIVLGMGIERKTEFCLPLPSCLDLIVKEPLDEIKIPEPYNSHPGVMDFIRICLSKEKELVPNWNEYYAYLTIDNRKVDLGKTHRNRGWHFDGMQGSRYPVKLKPCHQYICSNTLPTEFAIQSVKASHLNEESDNFFSETGKQILDPNVWKSEPFQIVLMNAYHIHRGIVAQESINRMFMRLDFSLKKQNRLGNSLNPLIPNPFTYEVREMPEELKVQEDDTGWNKGKKF